MGKVEIRAFPSGPLATNSYLVISGNDAAIIDAAPDVTEALLKTLSERLITPTKIIFTHSHWDHIADAFPLRQSISSPVDVLIHEEDAYNLIQPGSDHLPCRLHIEGVTPTRLLHDGDTFTIGTSVWRVIHTPGHSPGSICLYCAEDNILLAGDTLFKASIGTLSLPTSQPERMWPSLKKLAALAPNTAVYPGHGETTTIGREPWLIRAEQIFG